MSAAIIKHALLSRCIDTEVRAVEISPGLWAWEAAADAGKVYAGTASVRPGEAVQLGIKCDSNPPLGDGNRHSVADLRKSKPTSSLWRRR